jgi:hypothetical protein
LLPVFRIISAGVITMGRKVKIEGIFAPNYVNEAGRFVKKIPEEMLVDAVRSEIKIVSN